MKWILVVLQIVIFSYSASAVESTSTPSNQDKASAKSAEPVTLYSTRQEHLLRPLIDKYEKETGRKIELLTGEEGPLIERLRHEKGKSKADIFMTVDAGNLWYATDLGLFEPVRSETLEKNVPKHLRDPKGHWYGLSVRARTIFYNPKKVKKGELSTYEDLANDKWKGRLCLRTSKKVYNQSLVAMMIERIGAKKAAEVVKGWVENLATDVFSNDTKLLEAIHAGQCDVGIANSYYYGRLVKEKPKVNVALFWANQDTSGTHVNISGAGVLKNSPQKEDAIRFLEWLTGEEAQAAISSMNFEFPANPKANSDPLIRSWGEFKHDQANLSIAGRRQAEAVKLMTRAGYK